MDCLNMKLRSNCYTEDLMINNANICINYKFIRATPLGTVLASLQYKHKFIVQMHSQCILCDSEYPTV